MKSKYNLDKIKAIVNDFNYQKEVSREDMQLLVDVAFDDDYRNDPNDTLKDLISVPGDPDEDEVIVSEARTPSTNTSKYKYRYTEKVTHGSVKVHVMYISADPKFNERNPPMQESIDAKIFIKTVYDKVNGTSTQMNPRYNLSISASSCNAAGECFGYPSYIDGSNIHRKSVSSKEHTEFWRSHGSQAHDYCYEKCTIPVEKSPTCTTVNSQGYSCAENIPKPEVPRNELLSIGLPICNVLFWSTVFVWFMAKICDYNFNKRT